MDAAALLGVPDDLLERQQLHGEGPGVGVGGQGALERGAHLQGGPGPRLDGHAAGLHRPQPRQSAAPDGLGGEHVVAGLPRPQVGREERGVGLLLPRRRRRGGVDAEAAVGHLAVVAPGEGDHRGGDPLPVAGDGEVVAVEVEYGGLVQRPGPTVVGQPRRLLARPQGGLGVVQQPHAQRQRCARGQPQLPREPVGGHRDEEDALEDLVAVQHHGVGQQQRRTQCADEGAGGLRATQRQPGAGLLDGVEVGDTDPVRGLTDVAHCTTDLEASAAPYRPGPSPGPSSRAGTGTRHLWRFFRFRTST